MKHWYLALAIVLFSLHSSAQNTYPYPSTGNIGIGTTTPLALLHTATNNYDHIIMQANSNGTLAQQKFQTPTANFYIGLVGSNFPPPSDYIRQNGAFMTVNGAGGLSIVAQNTAGELRFYTGGNTAAYQRFKIDNTGKYFGYSISRQSILRDSAITVDPTTGEWQVTPLRINAITFQDTRSVATLPSNYSSNLNAYLKTNTTIGLPSSEPGLSSILGWRGGANSADGYAHEMAFTDSNHVYIRSGATTSWDGWTRVLTENGTGNVSIGSSAVRGKLNVNGDVITRKLRITQTGWADFVFDSTYSLMSLAELERFISANRHLPGVPTSSEVEQEGIDVSDTQVILLQKIEELTLHLIEQQKQIEELKKANTILDEKLERKTSRSTRQRRQ